MSFTSLNGIHLDLLSMFLLSKRIIDHSIWSNDAGSQVKCSINIQGLLAKWACFDITRLDTRKQSDKKNDDNYQNHSKNERLEYSRQDHQLLTAVAAAAASNSIFEHWFRNWMAAMVWNYYHNHPTTMYYTSSLPTNYLMQY